MPVPFFDACTRNNNGHSLNIYITKIDTLKLRLARLACCEATSVVSPSLVVVLPPVLMVVLPCVLLVWRLLRLWWCCLLCLWWCLSVVAVLPHLLCPSLSFPHPPAFAHSQALKHSRALSHAQAHTCACGRALKHAPSHARQLTRRRVAHGRAPTAPRPRTARPLSV